MVARGRPISFLSFIVFISLSGCELIICTFCLTNHKQTAMPLRTALHSGNDNNDSTSFYFSNSYYVANLYWKQYSIRLRTSGPEILYDSFR